MDTAFSKYLTEVMSTLLKVFQRTIEQTGRKLGETHAKDFLRVLGLPIDSSSFSIFIDRLCRYAFWFTCDISEGDEGDIFHLKNDLGWKWTKFLKGYLESTAKKVFGLSFTIETTEFTVTLKVRTPLHEEFEVLKSDST